MKSPLKLLLLSLLPLLLLEVLRRPMSSPRENLKVGVILPLTGPTADYGHAIQNSIRLAQQDHPQQRVQFVYEDASSSDVKQAVAAFQKLRSQDQVDLTYTWGVAFCKALAPIAETAKHPLIGQCIDPSSSKGREYVLRFMNYTDQYMAETLRYIRQRGWKKIGILLVDQPYMEEILAALKRQLRPDEQLEVIERYQLLDMDFHPTISKLRGLDVDVLGVLLWTGQISRFYLQLKEQHLQIPTFGSNLFESQSELALARGALEGAVFAGNQINPEFRKRYREAFGNESQLTFGALAYDFAVLLGEQFEKKPKGAKELLQTLTAIPERRTFAGAGYVLRRTENAGTFFEFSVTMKKIENGEFIELGPQG